MWILINFVDYILKCNILALNSVVAHIVFLLDGTGLGDFLGPFKGSLHSASSPNTGHSSASPYRTPPGTGCGDIATEASIIMEGGFDQCVPEWLQPFGQWPHCDSPWTCSQSRGFSSCSAAAAQSCVLHSHLCGYYWLFGSLWFWYSSCKNFLDSIYSVLSWLLLALLLVDCPSKLVSFFLKCIFSSWSNLMF